MANERTLRADARQNRARVLEVAAEVFATEGLSVPVHEVARRAGVGTGTVSRHFPTKEDLLVAVMSARLVALTAKADELAREKDPATAFVGLFAALSRAGAADCGLAELAAAGARLDAIDRRAGADLCGWLQRFLTAAQDAGAVRPDVTYADVRALMSACMSRGSAGLEPILAVVTDGLLMPRP